MRRAALVLALLLTSAAAFAAEVTFDIEAQPLATALAKYAQQADLQVLFPQDTVRNLKSNAVRGKLDKEKALRQLLKQTGLQASFTSNGTVLVKTTPTATGASAEQLVPVDMRLARLESREAAGTTAKVEPESSKDEGKGIPEMLVKGARTSNIDIQRTEDDVQPYVVFTAEDIERSTATSLDQFLLARLPMNTSRLAAEVITESLALTGNRSSIDLRGLGANQTLILINGRRVPAVGTDSTLSQADINGIPMSSVARIEILPSTAGGIYGGGATGGVINIILKDDYRGLEINARYDGTFRKDAQQRVLEANGGFSLEEGRTTVMLSASYRDSVPLRLADRDFAVRSRELLLQNNPAVFSGSTMPLGGTTNIRSTNGSPLVLQATGQSLGYATTYVPYGYAGPATDGGRALAANAGKYNLDWPTGTQGLERGVTTAPTVQALRLNLRRHFTDRIEAFVDASHTTNDTVSEANSFTTYVENIPANTPNNPFTTPISVRFPANDYDLFMDLPATSEVTNATGGVIVRLPRNWTVQGEYGWGQSENDYAINQLSSVLTPFFRNGTLSVLRDVTAYPQDYSPYAGPATYTSYQPDPQGANFENLTLRLAGPTFRMPGGPVMVSALLEERTDEVDSSIAAAYSATTSAWSYTYRPARKQTTQGAYVEITAPLISAANARPLARALDLQVSGRRDRIGSRTLLNTSQVGILLPSPDAPVPEVNYLTTHVEADQHTFGLRYQPFESLALRVSNGVGVLPPSLSQLVPFVRNNINVAQTADPKRNGTPVTAVAEVRSSGNPNLKPESSDSWSAGAIFTPAFLPGFRLSVDYTRIEKTDEISTLAAQVILDREEIYPDRIRRDALTVADQQLGYQAGRINYFDMGLTNIAYTRVEAYDVRADYQWTTSRGVFRVDAAATYQTNFEKQLLSTTPVTEYMGFLDGPLKLRGNAGITWERGMWTLGWNSQYYDPFLIYGATAIPFLRDMAILNQGGVRYMPRQIYHDMSFKYRVDEAPLWGGIFAHTDFLLGISNVFDCTPPTALYSVIVPASVPSPTLYSDPRLRRYSISIRKSFH